MPRSHEPPANLNDLNRKFRERFGVAPSHIVRAPGRVNLIGEHTDYNGGFVLPVAIDRYVTVLASPREDNKVRLFSTAFRDMASFTLDRLEPTQEVWYSYVEGMAWAMQQAGLNPPGLNMIIDSTVPVGAGLSSSAALEMASGYSFNLIGQMNIKRRPLALFGQRAENDFVGARTGIMDQFISALGQRDNAILIDCQTLDYQSVPFNLDTLNYRLVVIHTGVEHAHASGEYNRRRVECEEAVAQIKRLSGEEEINSLRDVSLQLFDQVKNLLPQVLRKRARHVITENRRTLDAVSALKRNDFKALRELMLASHASLRDDYQVTVAELDRLVELAAGQESCVGARMTGGGFGGCTINIVRNDAISQFIEGVFERYKEEMHHPTAQYYICSVVDGVAEVQAKD